MMLLQKAVIPGLTRNPGSCERVEFTGLWIRSGMTEIKNSDFLQQHQTMMRNSISTLSGTAQLIP